MDPVIQFDKVSKQFSDTQQALGEVTFSINPGEFVFITGPSGSGKTTIMRLLTKEYEPSTGEISYNGSPLTSIKQSKVHLHRRNIGVVFQDFKLLPDLNVWENIALALSIIGVSQSEIEQRVTDLLNLIGMTDKAFLFPTQLSGGEAQRVSIARALAPAPSVIFADEPTGNLDPHTSLTIAKLLHTINKLGTTVLFATHDVSVLSAMEGERHIRLEKGSLAADSGQSNQSVTFTAEVPEEKPKKVEKKTKNTSPEKESEEDTKADTKKEEEHAHSRTKKKSWWPLSKKNTIDKSNTKVETQKATSDTEVTTEVSELDQPS